MEKKVRDFARKVTFFHSLWKRSNEIVFKTWAEFETLLLPVQCVSVQGSDVSKERILK